MSPTAVDRDHRITWAVPPAFPDAIGFQPTTGLRMYDRQNAVRTYFRSGTAPAPANVQNTVRLGVGPSRSIWAGIRCWCTGDVSVPGSPVAALCHSGRRLNWAACLA